MGRPPAGPFAHLNPKFAADLMSSPAGTNSPCVHRIGFVARTGPNGADARPWDQDSVTVAEDKADIDNGRSELPGQWRHGAAPRQGLAPRPVGVGGCTLPRLNEKISGSQCRRNIAGSGWKVEVDSRREEPVMAPDRGQGYPGVFGARAGHGNRGVGSGAAEPLWT